MIAGEEQLGYERAALVAARESRDLTLTAFIQFTLGFCLLWASRLDEAEAEMRESLALANRAGDATTAVRSLSYLAVIERKRGHVEPARALALRTLEAAERTEMREYVLQATATLAWAAWREADAESAELHARTAWTGWDDVLPIWQVFGWMPLWPLLAVEFARGGDGVAIAHARTIIEPTRQPMPPELESLLAEAVAAHERGDAELRHARLADAAALAVRDGYL
jgi:hypothetical protein